MTPEPSHSDEQEKNDNTLELNIISITGVKFKDAESRVDKVFQWRITVVRSLKEKIFVHLENVYNLPMLHIIEELISTIFERSTEKVDQFMFRIQASQNNRTRYDHLSKFFSIPVVISHTVHSRSHKNAQPERYMINLRRRRTTYFGHWEVHLSCGGCSICTDGWLLCTWLLVHHESQIQYVHLSSSSPTWLKSHSFGNV